MKILIFILNLYFLNFCLNHCIHDDLEYSVDWAEPDSIENGRNLASVYSNIRISVDYTCNPTSFYYRLDFSSNNNPIYSYVKEQLIPAAKSYFQKTLKVNSITSPIKYTKSTICPGIQTPSVYATTGITSDIVFFIAAESSTTNYVAYSQPCILVTGTNRPIVALITYNYNYVDGTNFKTDFETTLHEMIHAFGLSSQIFKYYYDPTTQSTKQGVTKNVTINNQIVEFLTVEPAITFAREYFGCPSLEGILLENQGGSGSKGSHFERRVFGNEIMTSSIIDDSRITNLTLALLESTGWYQVDYSMSEPMYWGKGKGCGFIYDNCVSNGATTTSYPDEFCIGLSKIGCTLGGKAQAYCGAYRSFVVNPSLDPNFNYFNNNTALTDDYADNCPYFRSFSNLKCEYSSNAANAYLKNAEFYGNGSRCFTGNLAPLGQSLSSSISYCFSYQCVGSYPNYQVYVNVGSSSILCNSKTSKSVIGYSGEIDCPDPNFFCQTAGDDYCPKGCNGNGICVNNRCICNDGWNSSDCAYNFSYFGMSYTTSSDPVVVRVGRSDETGIDGILIAPIAVGIAFVFCAVLMTVKKVKECRRRERNRRAHQTQQANPPPINRMPQNQSAIPIYIDGNRVYYETNDIQAEMLQQQMILESIQHNNVNQANPHQMRHVNPPQGFGPDQTRVVRGPNALIMGNMRMG